MWIDIRLSRTVEVAITLAVHKQSSLHCLIPTLLQSSRLISSRETLCDSAITSYSSHLALPLLAQPYLTPSTILQFPERIALCANISIMPRQNRYHPYAHSRQSSRASATNPTLFSQQYQSPSTFTLPPPALCPIPEFAPVIVESPKQYQGSFAPYTPPPAWEGEAFISRSVVQGPDGFFHIQMEPIKFPSEYIQSGSKAGPDTTTNASPTASMSANAATMSRYDYSDALRKLLSAEFGVAPAKGGRC
jgi:hypothetical protein